MTKAVCVLSGGMDSTTLLYDVVSQGHDTYALSFDYGQKHKKELEMARRTCEKLGIPFRSVKTPALNSLAESALTRQHIDVPDGHYEEENMKITVVPNRNMVMLALAASYAISLKVDYLYYGAHGGDHAIYHDCRTEFVDAMRKVIEICDEHKLELRAPYVDKDKGYIASRGKELGVDYSLTWTCYKGREKACGKCGSCVERLEAFETAGMEDPIDYETRS